MSQPRGTGKAVSHSSEHTQRRPFIILEWERGYAAALYAHSEQTLIYKRPLNQGRWIDVKEIQHVVKQFLTVLNIRINQAVTVASTQAYGHGMSTVYYQDSRWHLGNSKKHRSSPTWHYFSKSTFNLLWLSLKCHLHSNGLWFPVRSGHRGIYTDALFLKLILQELWHLVILQQGTRDISDHRQHKRVF